MRGYCLLPMLKTTGRLNQENFPEFTPNMREKVPLNGYP